MDHRVAGNLPSHRDTVGVMIQPQVNQRQSKWNKTASEVRHHGHLIVLHLDWVRSGSLRSNESGLVGRKVGKQGP